ncbi:MAG: peptidoglycan-associated lipoprotein Pal [Betaproteobacteria bacterium]|nr:peptidoglycan-associated lipoprotein Pal [Gammaproteobacteria bacterium]MDH3438140.1 peptidoglycan-associated lipoprotein Pal [Betaproteobacteria bacterium]
MKRLLLGVLMLGLVAACGTTPKEQDGAAVEDRKPGSGEAVDRPAVMPAETKPLTDKPFAGGPLKDPNNILSKRSVYFDFDSNLVKDEFKPIVAAHARYLQQNGGATMRIEGNADERGSREYNLALGQRRADAVRKMMQLLGARGGQMETVSFGEEKPRGTGNDEASWAENRRADIVYRGE